MNKQMEPLYDKTVKCPFCNHSFKTKKVRLNFARPLKTDSDFCSYYKEDDQNPILYFINVCPECGFAFSDHTSAYFPPGTTEQIEQQITLKWKKHSFSDRRTKKLAVQTYKLALLSATLKNEKHIVLAGICLRLVWLYRMLELKEQEQRFLELALAEYEEAYTYGDYEKTNTSEISILYLLGELNRRLGHFHEAVHYFSRVVNHPMKDFEPKYVQMAREQWRLTRDEYGLQKEEESNEQTEQKK